MHAPLHLRIGLVALLALAGCGPATQAMLSPSSASGESGGHLLIVGTDPLVRHQTLAFTEVAGLPARLAGQVRAQSHEALSVGNERSMEMLCDPHAQHPAVALLTRSPSQAEVQRCARAGYVPSADLVALNHGAWEGHAPFDQVWIAFLPGELGPRSVGARAVQRLRYDFGQIIEGSEYAEVFEARRE